MKFRGQITKNAEGKRIYTSYIYPTVPPSENDIYVLSQAGDRLDTLAHKYYNDVTKWKLIAVANNLGKGTLIVPPGKQIRIPENKDY